MATQFEIGDEQLADLRRVCFLGPDLLSAVAQVLEGLRTLPLQPDQLLVLVQGALGGDRSDAESVCRQSLALNGLMRQANLAIEDLASGLDKAIEAYEEDDPEFIRSWRNSREPFLRLVGAKACRLTAKAIDLSYDFANLFRRGRILADVRPLFNQTNDDIEGVVISYTLRLRYDNVAGDHDLSLAMDQRDVEQLKQECEKALKKGATAKGKMAALNLAAFITGE
ncbi:hypothetical protein [Planctellipticum variicoloris]|uniref:hypothetical protein n=1 Tax=Planctellipticum variicoloris TaxID=3064265 RepID=UPI00301407F6|nr:hypothetical protein SH412_005090 [Planctomycetaceae bacterium SH412]